MFKGTCGQGRGKSATAFLYCKKGADQQQFLQVLLEHDSFGYKHLRGR
jgi:hypothetical protein